MQSLCRNLIRRHSSNIVHFTSTRGYIASCNTSCPKLTLLGFDPSIPTQFAAAKFVGNSIDSSKRNRFHSLSSLVPRSSVSLTNFGFGGETSASFDRSARPGLFEGTVALPPFACRWVTTVGNPLGSASPASSEHVPDVAPRIKFKRLDKTARHIMQIINKEAVEEVRAKREIPDIRPGYIVQLKVEVPENKRRVSILKGIVIARRNAGMSTTFRIRRLVAGVGVESLFHLYSPNIKEIKVLDKKKVRRAKLYYLRDKMNALKKH